MPDREHAHDCTDCGHRYTESYMVEVYYSAGADWLCHECAEKRKRHDRHPQLES